MLVAVAQDFLVRAVVAAARSIPGYPRLKAIDLSCGRGEVLATLQRDGCDALGTHYRENDYEADSGRRSWLTLDSRIDGGVDLMQPLPYESTSFDLVILSEVIEHLPSWIPVVREAGRILRPGGHLILSTPN